MDWELRVSRCKLLHLEWISNEVLLYSTGNYSHSHDRTRWKNMGKGMRYICLKKNESEMMPITSTHIPLARI